MRSSTSSVWQRNDFIANAHNGARLADIDGDGRDEVLGGTIISPKGKLLTKITVKGHIDALSVADVRPDIEGLEVIALEEGPRRIVFKANNPVAGLINKIANKLSPVGNHIFLFNHNGLIWQGHFKHREPQNTAVGEFDVQSPGLEIWCRSRYDEYQRPFVFDATGNFIANYKINKAAPGNWTKKGVEVISPISWTNGKRHFIVAKERHKSGDVAIIEAISGKFLYRFKEEADRLYIADVYGDGREELIVLNKNQLRIYQNDQP